MIVFEERKEFKEKLIIKNFGPIKEVEIPLNRFVVLIGESGSGKSAIMKTASLVKFIYKKMNYNKAFDSDVENLEDKFGKFLIDSELNNFLSQDSVIEFLVNEKKVICIREAKLVLDYDALENKALCKDVMLGDYRSALPYFFTLRATPPFYVEDMAKNFEMAFKEFGGKFTLDTMRLELMQKSNVFFNEYVLKGTESEVKLTNASSGEKNVTILEIICSYFAKKYNFLAPVFPDTIKQLEYGIRQLELDDKSLWSDDLTQEDRHRLINNKIGKGNDSGLSDINLIAFANLKNRFKTFLNLFIEEPESNLFPAQQEKVAYYLASLLREKNEPSIMLATHSPYILTSLNNLLFAGQLYADDSVDKEKLGEIIEQKYALKQGEFSAFLVKNGELFDIIDSESGLVVADAIDEISSEIADKFDALLDLKDFDED